MDSFLYVLFFVVLAVPTFFVDRRFGARIYRPVWNLWHEKPLPEGVERGFIVGRKARERILPTIALTIFFCFILSYYIHDPIELVMKAPLVFLGLFIGFILVGLALREGKKSHTVVDTVCEKLDDIEVGKVDLSDVAQNALRTGVDKLKDAANDAATSVTEKVSELRAEVTGKPRSSVDEAAKLPPLPEPPTPPKRPFREVLNDYAKRERK